MRVVATSEGRVRSGETREMVVAVWPDDDDEKAG